MLPIYPVYTDRYLTIAEADGRASDCAASGRALIVSARSLARALGIKHASLYIVGSHGDIDAH